MKLGFALILTLHSGAALAQRAIPAHTGAVGGGSGGSLFETLGIIFVAAIVISLLGGIVIALFELLRWLLSLPVALWRKIWKS